MYTAIDEQAKPEEKVKNAYGVERPVGSSYETLPVSVEKMPEKQNYKYSMKQCKKWLNL